MNLPPRTVPALNNQSFTVKRDYEEPTILEKHVSFNYSNQSKKDSLSPNKNQEKKANVEDKAISPFNESHPKSR